MPICEKCKTKFSFYAVIDGKKRNLSGRKYCLNCSPFGKHNTKKLNGIPRKDQKEHKCYACGEKDPSKFYRNKRKTCGRCHNQYTLKKGQEKRKKAINFLGGKCILCGYDKYYGSIDLHHINPNEKDPNFSSLRGWSWGKIEEEIKKCVPLCRNCHGEVHAGILEIPDSYKK
jgi:hypothetical protein